jgi:hypothetical protein
VAQLADRHSLGVRPRRRAVLAPEPCPRRQLDGFRVDGFPTLSSGLRRRSLSVRSGHESLTMSGLRGAVPANSSNSSS